VVETFSDVAGTGIDLYEGYLYVSDNTAVYRFQMAPGELVPQSPPETIISGFPVQQPHAAKAFAFNEGGDIYVNVGAPSNTCQDPDRTPGAAGQDPCPQLDRQAGVWRFDAGRPGQTQEADGHRFVTGTRNIVAIAWNPVTSNLYAVQHGRDQLNNLWPELFTVEQSAEIPAEEFFLLEDGADFGWPYCYFDPIQGKKVLAPEYGGDGKEVGLCADKRDPIYAFPGHYGPNDLLFYTSSQFPSRYRNGAFIAFHGSWNRAPEPQGGYQVAFLPFNAEGPTGDWETFADGFKGAEPLMNPSDAVYRPMGLAMGPDGSLYVTDSQKGRIWRIVYTGES
jgi:glucose/arabinose dehydrogenase